MARRLVGTVTVTDPKTRAVVVFRPGDEVPAWARKAITNPAAWAQDEAEDEAEEPGTGTDVSGPAHAGTGDGDDSGDDKDTDDAGGSDSAGGEQAENTDGDSPVVEAPPRAGRGSSVEAWQDYADAFGVEYQPGASRDDIVAAVDAAQK